MCLKYLGKMQVFLTPAIRREWKIFFLSLSRTNLKDIFFSSLQQTSHFCALLAWWLASCVTLTGHSFSQHCPSYLKSFSMDRSWRNWLPAYIFWEFVEHLQMAQHFPCYYFKDANSKILWSIGPHKALFWSFVNRQLPILFWRKPRKSVLTTSRNTF